MAAAMGKDGFVSWGGNTTAVAYVDSWTISPSLGTADVTAYGDSARAFISTLREWTATVSGTLDMSSTDQSYVLNDFTSTATSTSFEIRLYDRTTCYWSGSVLPVSAAINSQIGDKVTYTMNFQGTGNLAYTTS
jgi:hypothetical protein